MARVVRDYPELQGSIGDMVARPKDALSVMSAGKTYGGHIKADIKYNPLIDWEGMESEIIRAKAARDIKYKNQITEDLDHAGTHELGHVMASLLVRGNSNAEIIEKSKRHDLENGIIKKVLTTKGILTEDEQNDPENGLKYHQEDGVHMKAKGYPMNHYKGHIDFLSSNVVKDKNLTSSYGMESPGEFFAEAFHDVYTHGSKARQTSMEIVKEYERITTERQRKQIMHKPARPWWKKIADWFNI